MSFSVSGEHPVKGVLDGAPLALAKKDADDDNPARHEGELKLAIGKHLVVLCTMADPEVEGEWKLGVAVTPDTLNGTEGLDFSVQVHQGKLRAVP